WHSIRTRNFGIDIPLGLGILVLYFRSAFEIISGSGAGYMDSLGGLVFFLLIGKWFQQITYHRISFERDYKSYFPVAALKIKGGKEESISVNKLEPGDTILVRHKEIIPGDGILKHGLARIDYSFVTGEAEPVEKHSGDKIYAGGRQVGDAIELTLTKKVSQSYLTQLWNEDAFHQEKLAGASRLANSVSRYFTAIILLISFVALAYWLPKDVRTAFKAFTAVLIIACPCAAALNIPFTLGNAVRILARKGFFIKNTNAVEALNRITAVVFDKTGTLTHASAGDELKYDGEPLAEEEKAWFKSLALHSTHPVSRQLFENLNPAGDPSRVTKKPFYLSDFQEFTGQGTSGKVGERRLRIGSKAFIG
ncbi:MAG: HAD-IC family P-type ATPase, partial [Bacteroidota bacterium]